MELHEKIRKSRIEKGYTQEQLAEKLGIARSTMITWERGTHTPSFPNLVELGRILSTSFTDKKTEAEQTHLAQMQNVLFVPVINRLVCGSCGNGNDYEGVEWEFEKEPYPVASSDLLGYSWQGYKPMIITAEGDSMSPFIQDGDKVLFLNNYPVSVGDVAVISINGTVFIKGISSLAVDSIELQSFNREYYPPKLIQLKEGQEVKLLGKVLEVVSSRKVPKVL